MEAAKRGARRKHEAQLKARVVAECAVAGASVARIALEHGLNANLVHRWRRIAEGREQGRHATARAAQFLALPIGAPTESAPADIHIELARGATRIKITWPSQAAPACAAWLRALLR
jgi:transposase